MLLSRLHPRVWCLVECALPCTLLSNDCNAMLLTFLCALILHSIDALFTTALAIGLSASRCLVTFVLPQLRPLYGEVARILLSPTQAVQSTPCRPAGLGSCLFSFGMNN